MLFLEAKPLAMFLGASGKGADLTMLAVRYLRGILTGLPALVMTGVIETVIQSRLIAFIHPPVIQ